MNLYNQEELDRIKKIKETNDKLEEFFNDKRTEWNKIVDSNGTNILEKYY